MANHRTAKASQEIKRCLSQIIMMDIKDPNVPPLCSIVAVEVSKDMKHAKAKVSVMQDEEKSEAAVNALNRASGFIRHRLNEMLALRNIPSVKFVIDHSIEYSIEIASTIKKLHDEQEH